MFQMTIDVINPNDNQKVITKVYEFRNLNETGPALRDYESYAEVLGLVARFVCIVKVD